MSPELNGNPPVLIKRKKNREKKHTSTPKINDFNVPTYNYFQGNLNSYPNIALPEPTAYYPFSHYSLPTEPIQPMSLPFYLPYQNTSIPINGMNPNINSNVNIPNKMSFKMQPSENDYMSLPVGNIDQNENEKTFRRFSDPGLPNDDDSSCNSNDSSVIQGLTYQINVLKENNRKLNRDVTEMRMELNMLKQQHNIRHFERDYEPGMLTDIIREIRDAARVREDALLSKVRHMIEEKQLSMSQFHIVTEKNRNHDRLSKLEEQVKNMNISHIRSEDNISLPSTTITEENSGSARQVFEMEREALLLRRELQDVRAKKEESDNKVLKLEKRLSHLPRPKDTSASETSDYSKTSVSSTDTLSVTTQSSSMSTPQRITLSGPVTDL